MDRDAAGNKLIVTVEGGSPVEIVAADTPVRAAFPKDKAAPEVVELTYADYVKQCGDPVLFPSVDLPSTTFKLSEFTQSGNCNPDGSRTFRDTGGFGMGGVVTTVKIPKDGHYVMTLRAKGGKAEAGNWPSVVASIGGIYGKNNKARIINTAEYGEYRWYCDLKEGKLDIKLAVPSDYYNCAMLPGCQKGRDA